MELFISVKIHIVTPFKERKSVAMFQRNAFFLNQTCLYIYMYIYIEKYMYASVCMQVYVCLYVYTCTHFN